MHVGVTLTWTTYLSISVDAGLNFINSSNCVTGESFVKSLFAWWKYTHTRKIHFLPFVIKQSLHWHRPEIITVHWSKVCSLLINLVFSINMGKWVDLLTDVFYPGPWNSSLYCSTWHKNKQYWFFFFFFLGVNKNTYVLYFTNRKNWRLYFVKLKCLSKMYHSLCSTGDILVGSLCRHAGARSHRVPFCRTRPSRFLLEQPLPSPLTAAQPWRTARARATPTERGAARPPRCHPPLQILGNQV